MFQPRYTMNGYELKEEPKANSSGHSRVLRILLTLNLPLLHGAIQERVAEVLTQEFLAHENVNGIVAEDSAHVNYPSLRIIFLLQGCQAYKPSPWPKNLLPKPTAAYFLETS